MRDNKILFLLLTFSFCTVAFGQSSPHDMLDSFSGKFITALRTHEKQRVYLVTDKSVFSPGEHIWFKAFLINAVSQKISNKSRLLFVDLVNEKDSVIKVLILDAFNKQLNSRIQLPHNMAAGYYWLRAYTKQMAGGDTNGICVKSIYIASLAGNTNFVKQNKKAGNPENIPTITFYPEGGSIISGVNSKVGLRAVNIDDEPIMTAVSVKDNRDTIVTQFSTNINGLGKFDFEPSGYRKYKAVINWYGKEISYPLPSFNFYAGQLSVSKQSSGYKFTILLGDSIYSRDFGSYLLGVSKDSLIFAGIGKGQYEVAVNNEKLPEGIATFYLFDKGFNLLSERSIYIHENQVHIKASTEKSVYARRKKVALDIAVTDAKQFPVPSLLTVSVTDSLVSDPGEQCSVPNMAYDPLEFDNISMTRRTCINDNESDLLMLIKKNTYQLLSKTIDPPASGDKDSLLYIKGVVLNGNEPAANKILSLLSNSGVPLLYKDTTDKRGHFCFRLENYADSTQFVLEVRNLKGARENTTIVIDTFRYPQLNTPVSLKHFLPLQSAPSKEYLRAYYNTSSIEMDKQSLPPVTVRDWKKPVNYNESKRVSRSSAILTSDDLDEKNSVSNSILKVGGMHLLNGYLVINGPTAMKGPDASSEPMLLVDGVQVALSLDLGENSGVMSYLKSLNPKDIDFIEILKGPEGASYGVRGGNGVILVNLLSTRREVKLQANNLKTFYATGISNTVDFTNAGYQPEDVKAATDKDNRSTLFWDGNFLCDRSGNAALTFYTSDIAATYKVTITGITIHGDFIYKTISFQSK